MPAVIMESGQRSLQNGLDGDVASELIDAGRFCFSCEQMFANRQCLEEHVCSCVSYICSCGTEFSDYKDMQEHSSTHEPGHQVLDHRTIKRRRIEKCIEEEQKLKRLQIGDVVWKTQKVNHIPPVSLPVMPARQNPFTSSHKPQVLIQSAISQVPLLLPSASQASLLPKPVTTGTDIRNIFGDVGSPTVDLCMLYQPVVLVRKTCKLSKKEAYTCGKCGQCFVTGTSLVSHFNSHVTDKVSGCIGCGLLLSSKKLVPRFHVCNSPNHLAKFKLITAKPLIYRNPNAAIAERIKHRDAQRIQAIYSLQQKGQNPTTAGKSIRKTCITSTLKLKNETVRTYSRSSRNPYVIPSLHSKLQNSCASKTSVSVLSKVQSPIPTAYNTSTQGLPVFPTEPLKTPTHTVLSKLMEAASGQNAFKCRVCHFSFETTHMLQRHKCTKAQEFMAQRRRGGRNHTVKSVTPLVSPLPAQVNAERKHGMSPLGNVKNHQIMTVTLDQEDLDDDCYIVESGPDKPAEMIYQVTSSVPITT